MSKILIIDDEIELAELVQLRLEALGHEVFQASNGREGLQKLKESHPDLILLDVMMPELDGFEVCQIIKKNKDWEMIPVIMLTAKAQHGDDALCLAMGADDYISKPFDMKVLTQKIEKYLST